MKIYGISIQEELYLCNLKLEIVWQGKNYQFPRARLGNRGARTFRREENEDINLRRYVSGHD